MAEERFIEPTNYIDEIEDVCKEQMERISTNNTDWEEIKEAWQYVLDILPERDAAIRKEERDRVFKQIEEITDSCPHCDLLDHCPLELIIGAHK